MLPTFLVIGAMKAGTTSLHEYLRRHPGIAMSDPKELDFFVAERNWPRGVGWYEAQFPTAEGQQARGESSPNYTKQPMFMGVPERIAEVLPDVRLIYLVRDPIERMVSHYHHARRKGHRARPIHVELLDNPHLMACSSFALQLGAYLPHIPLERILVIPSEQLRWDPRGTVARVAAFVGADPEQLPADLGPELHRTSDVGGADGPTGWLDRWRLGRIRSELRARLAPDVARLRELTGVTIPGWEDAVR